MSAHPAISIDSTLRHAAQELGLVAQNAPLEARLLAMHAWDYSPERLVRDSHLPIGGIGRSKLQDLVERRLKHEPISHILGSREFWRDMFEVTADVLTPRPDSETVIEALLRHRPDTQAPLRVLDLGTGSGCLVLSTLREYPLATGVGADQSPAALAVAKRNAARLGLEARSVFTLSNWCSNVSGPFDVVLSNPPYIPTADIAALDADVRDYEPHAALDGGADGLDCYRRIVQQLSIASDCSAEQSCAPLGGRKAGSLLAPRALVLFEVGAGQAEDVAQLGQQHGFDLLEISPDLAGISRVVVLQPTDCTSDR